MLDAFDTSAFRGGLDPPQVAGPKPGRPPARHRLLVTADAGGSNSYRYRAWKAELAAVAQGGPTSRANPLYDHCADPDIYPTAGHTTIARDLYRAAG